MGFETYEEMEAWADSLEQSDAEAHDANLIAGVEYDEEGYEAEPLDDSGAEDYRPFEYAADKWLLRFLEGESTRRDSNEALIDSLRLELELRGVAVWRCDGCDRWLADTRTAHINHSADCEANGS